MSSTEIKELIERAYKNEDAPHLAKALEGVKLFQRQTNAELTHLIQAINLNNESDQTPTVEVAQPLVSERLARDAALVVKMNPLIPKDASATYPLKTNKLDLILKWTQEFDGKHFTTLWDGELPQGYVFDTEELPIMNWDAKSYLETLTIWGSSKGDVLKTELLNILLAQTGKTRVADLDLTIDYNHWEASEACMAATNWTDKSAIFHSTPFPSTLTFEDFTKVDVKFEGFSYFVIDSKRKLRLGFPHCGFAYGGQRLDGIPIKPYPGDCSYMMSSWTGCPVTFTSADELAFAREADPESYGQVDPVWLTGPEAKDMKGCFDLVTVRDPQKDIKAGQVWAVRKFKETDTAATLRDPKQYGSGGGHTALVLGFDAHAKMIHTVSCNRSYPTPEMNGVGIQSFPYPGPSHHKVMFFSLKDTNFARAKSAVPTKAATATDKERMRKKK